MIKSERIIIRPIQSKDFDKFFEYFSDVSNRGMYFRQHMVSEVEFKSLFQKNGLFSDDLAWLLITDKSDKIIGATAYFKVQNYMNGYELGYIIFNKSERKKGYGSEALQLMTHYFFNTKPINRLQLGIVPKNIPSVKVAEKCGYSLEGVMKGAMFTEGIHMDVALYSLTRSEWELFKNKEN